MDIWDKLKKGLFGDDEEKVTPKSTITKVEDRVGKSKRGQPNKAKEIFNKTKEDITKNAEVIQNSGGIYDDQELTQPELYITDKNKKGSNYRLKSIGGNVTANVISSPLHAAGLISSAAAYPFVKAYSKFTGGPDDVFLPLLEKNLFSRAGEVLERQVRKDVGISQIEDMDKADQLINLGSMFVGPAPAKGEGLIKAMLKPGLQVSKDASKLTRLGQIGTQVALPLGMNEATRIVNEQEGILGDYSNPENAQDDTTNLVLAQRSNARGDKVYEVPVDLDEDNKDKSKEIVKTAAKIAAPIAAIAAARHTKAAKNLVKSIRDKKISRENAIKFSDSLSFGEKVLNTIDTANITDKLLAKGMIDDVTANALHRNTYTQSTNMFDTGTVYVGNNLIKTERSPRWILRDVQALKQQNPEQYSKFNSFMENTRQLQSKVYEYNRQHNTNYALTDLLTNPEISQELKSVEGISLNKQYENVKKLYDEIQKDGTFSKVLNNISDINNKTIDLALKTGEISEEFANDLRKNRNMFGLNMYLPGIKPIVRDSGIKGLINKVNRTTLNETLYKEANPFAFSKRSDIGTLEKAANWDESFELTYKNSIKRLLDNQQKRVLVENLMKNRDTGVKNLVGRIKELQENVNPSNYKETLQDVDKLTGDVTSMFDNVKFLGGYKNVNGARQIVPNTNQLFSVLNKKASQVTGVENSLNSKIGQVEAQTIEQALINSQNKAKYISIPYDDKMLLFEVDDWIGQIVQQDPQNAGLVYNGMKNLTNLSKMWITGKVNPIFSPITTSYTATDQLTGLKNINKELGTKVKRSSVIKNYANGTPTEVFSYRTNANKLDTIYKDLESGRIKHTPELDAEIAKLENDIRSNDLSQLKAIGANVQGRYPINMGKQKATVIDDGIGFTINSNKTLQNLINTIRSSRLVNNNATRFIPNALKFTNYALQSMRDVPTLGLYKSFAKTFTKNGKLDANRVMEVSRVIDKYTATGSLTPAQNELGSVIKGFNDLSPYFSDALSENLARGRMVNFGNIQQHFANLLDSNIPLQQELGSIAKGITTNDFVQSGVALVAAPTMIASIWNHSSEENEAAYNALPDTYKNRGIVFANAINGKPVVIPLTQSLMWLVTGLREGVMDPSLQINQNTYDYGSNLEHRLGEVADINWSVNLPTAVSLGINALGYRTNDANELTSGAINKYYALKGNELKSVSNEMNKETYYENGIFSPKQRAMVQTLFGNPGNAVTEAIDITKNRGDVSEGLKAGISKYFTTLTNLVNPKASTWSATSNEIYKNDEKIKGLPKDDKLSPEQLQVKNTILQYRNTRIKLLTDKIKDLRKDIATLRNTGKLGEDQMDYFGVQDKTDDITKQIKLLQSQKLKEYETLDKLLKQQYNTTLDEFTEGVKNNGSE